MPSPKSRPKPSLKTLAFEAIGTQWIIEIDDASDESILQAIKQRIEVFDKHYSRFRADSLVTKISQKAGTYTLPSDAKPMFDLYKGLYELTSGLMTPLIGQTLSDAGYDADYSFKPRPLVSPPSWDECLRYDFPSLVVKQPVLLDFGALGKGYLVDIIAELLNSKGHSSFIINAGGDIVHQGKSTVEIALEHPGDTSQAIGIAMIQNGALCGSAGNRRAWAGFNHVVNPETLTSPKHIAAVWAVADSAMLADAMTTALYFSDPLILQKRYTFRYAIVHSDFSLSYSKDFPAEFFDGEDV